ncbi:hypothetical protein [Actinomadura litoris]|uniref:Terminase small subunit n=1 Tax=Actinomadura litoris TaxID=2678616 RepID=A0A7K1LB34_9ACTN|nr:hypothetical protein [Actinomadura litoris]MUN41641.1 hypothetical protein [Actinomadura litoris]
MSDLETALRAALERWGPEIADTAPAAALDTARRLDGPKVSPSAASLLHGQLRQYLADLRELAPSGEEGDEIDELTERRRKRRAAGE